MASIKGETDEATDVAASQKSAQRPLLLNLSMPFYPIDRPWTVQPSFDQRTHDPAVYVDALRREILSSAEDFSDCQIPAVWVGGCSSAGSWGGICSGGIATHMADGALGRLLREMRGSFNFTREDGMPAEITLTAHPGMFAATATELVRLAHATRLWIDFATGSEEEARELGRFMGPGAMEVTDQIARPTGIDLTLSLLVGIPGQTEHSGVHSVEEALRHGATAVSLFSWTLDPTCELAKIRSAKSDAWRANVRHRIPEVQEAAAIRAAMEARLAGAGMAQYLPGEWALPGHESRYLQLLAGGCEQLGFGLGARTRFGGVAATNTMDWSAYLRASDDPTVTIVERHILSKGHIEG